MIQVKVWSLAVDEKNQYPVVVLQSLDGTKKLPIWIGPPEASAIAMEIAGKKFQRPLTHDLLVTMLNAVGARVLRVEINDLKENTFFARIFVEANGEGISIDARPSDSLAIALKTKAKIYVAPTLFTSELDTLLRADTEVAAAEPDEEERAQQLRALLENLELRDFGRFSF